MHLKPLIVNITINNAVNMIGDLNIHHIKDAYPLKFKNVEMIGKDIKITSVPK